MAIDKFYIKRHDRQPYYTARAIGSNSTALGISNAYPDSTISATYADTTIYAINTNGFPTSGNLILADYISVTYTGKTPTTFTGCTWSNGSSGQTFKIGTTITDVIDLTSATVRFTMVNTSDNSVKVNRSSAVITTAKIGDVEYRWASVDTDTSGVYLAEFEITPASTEKFTIPSDPADKAIIVVIDDLDNT